MLDNFKDNFVAIAISVILHLILGWLALRNIPAQNQLSEESVIEISYEAPPPSPQNPTSAKQMVSPSESTRDKPPPPTNRLSDVDSSVEKEQVRRGDPGTASVSKGTANDRQKAPPAKAEKAPQEKENTSIQKPSKVSRSAQQPEEKPQEKPKEVEPQSPKKLTNLKLDPATMLDKFGELERSETTSKDLTSKISGGGGSNSGLRNYKAFSRPTGSGAAFLGTGGVRDFLPGLPDGDITLLNAKASTYASFVRRVATQVFALMRQSGWDQLRYGDIRSINDFNTVIAVLSPDGRFLRAELRDPSGSSGFDSILVDAAKRGARDPNPPAGAASADGTIRFIFKSRSWAEGGSSGRNGAPVERRWLMLATGLE